MLREYRAAVFTLLAGPHPMSRVYRASIKPIVVSATLTRLHPVVKALQSCEQLTLTKAAKSKALLLLNALASEALRRGYDIKPGADRHALSVVVGWDEFGIQVSEQHDRVPHIATSVEMREAQRNPWKRIPEFDAKPSGRLLFELDQAWGTGRQCRWSDRKRLRVEDRLADILIGVETRAGEAVERRALEEERRRVREAAWREAMDQARVRYVDQALIETLGEQVNAWARCRQFRSFCDEIESRIDTREASSISDKTSEWINWIRSYTDEIYPLRILPSMPEVLEPSEGDLRPFLSGFSPYGPGI